MKIKINSDVFNIIDRLKQIDSGYFVLFNTNTKKFEIHNSETKNGYCLTIPYRQLDKRSLELVEKTHIKNYKKTISAVSWKTFFINLYNPCLCRVIQIVEFRRIFV